MGVIQVARADVSKERRHVAFEELTVGEMFSDNAEVCIKTDQYTAFSFSNMRAFSNTEHDVTRLSATILWEVEYEYVR